MQKIPPFFTWFITVLITVTPVLLKAAELRVAAASNFADVITTLAEQFEEKTGNKIILITGSTGKHYAQIKNGAPFDVFLAADVDRPEKLEQEGFALPGTRFTYAVGKLILWSPKPGIVDPDGKILQEVSFRHLSIANPKLAPYGKAAHEVLKQKKLLDLISDRLVTGQNIAQTFQFVKSGNAELGFVAYAQVKRPGRPIEGSIWEVPQELYTPIQQQAVLLKEKQVARDFLKYIKSLEAAAIIQAYGYDTP